MNKFFSCSLILIVDVLLGVYFNAYVVYTWQNFIAMLIGEVLFLCMPKSLINAMSVNKTFGICEDIAFREQNNEIKQSLLNIANLSNSSIQPLPQKYCLFTQAVCICSTIYFSLFIIYLKPRCNSSISSLNFFLFPLLV